MSEQEIQSLVNIRKNLIERYNRCKDYRSNKNALMREIDHAQIIHKVIVDIDKLISKYVNFS